MGFRNCCAQTFMTPGPSASSNRTAPIKISSSPPWSLPRFLRKASVRKSSSAQTPTRLYILTRSRTWHEKSIRMRESAAPPAICASFMTDRRPFLDSRLLTAGTNRTLLKSRALCLGFTNVNQDHVAVFGLLRWKAYLCLGMTGRFADGGWYVFERRPQIYLACHFLAVIVPC